MTAGDRRASLRHGSGSPARRAVASHAQRPVDLEAESPLSEVYLDSLLAAQLRLAGRILLLLGLAVGLAAAGVLRAAGPGRGGSWPGSRCPGWCSGLGVYPLLILLGWRYVVRAERNERDFVDLTGGPGDEPVTTP